MGYTHYWRMNQDIPRDAWAKIQADAAKIIAASPAKLALEYDEPERLPICDGIEIRFNAADEDESCETFVLRPEMQDFEFCKTRQYPYDTPVCAILACAAEHAPNAIRVSSDGDEGDWAEPLAWASKVLGRTVPSPISKAEAV
jgi:hypothetical protein